MIEVKLKIRQKVALEIDGDKRAALARIAQAGGDMLRERGERGVDYDGAPRPEVAGPAKRNRFWMHKADPRVASVPAGIMRPWNFGPGAPQWWVFRGSYRDFKVAIGRSGARGASFTGAMWKGLTAGVKMSRGDHLLRIYFGGSSKGSPVPGKGNNAATSFRNRDKARLLQFPGRSGVGSHEGDGGRQFDLMRFSGGELQQLVSQYVAGFKLFESGT